MSGADLVAGLGGTIGRVSNSGSGKNAPFAPRALGWRGGNGRIGRGRFA
jgi:hypothetical protein